jgi:hypothetical protein
VDCVEEKSGFEPLQSSNMKLVVFGLNDFSTTVVAIWRNVMTQMCLTSSGLNRNCRGGQKVMGAVHATFRRGFFILLDGHNELLSKQEF